MSPNTHRQVDGGNPIRYTPRPDSRAGFEAGRVRVLESEYYMSCWSQPTLADSRYVMGAWVSFASLSLHFVVISLVLVLCSFPPLFWCVSSSGGDKGSGSDWYSDAGALVQKSMAYRKPVIVVSFKYVFLLQSFLVWSLTWRCPVFDLDF